MLADMLQKKHSCDSTHICDMRKQLMQVFWNKSLQHHELFLSLRAGLQLCLDLRCRLIGCRDGLILLCKLFWRIKLCIACVQSCVGSDVIYTERRGQSQKPEEIYQLIEELVPGGTPALYTACAITPFPHLPATSSSH